MDWEFEVELIDAPDEDRCFAKNIHSPNFQSSRIVVLRPDCIPEHWEGTKDLETTVVHEMLHTRLLYAFGKKCDWHGELAIETIAQNLVSLRRGIKIEELD